MRALIPAGMHYARTDLLLTMLVYPLGCASGSGRRCRLISVGTVAQCARFAVAHSGGLPR